MEQFITLVSKFPVIILITLAALTTVAGDYFGKLWSVNLNYAHFWIGLVFYLLAGFFYFPSLLRGNLISTSIAWTVLATAGFLIVGFVIFHEELSMLQWLGVGFGVVAILLLNI